jgi:hypothetical protein
MQRPQVDIADLPSDDPEVEQPSAQPVASARPPAPQVAAAPKPTVQKPVASPPKPQAPPAPKKKENNSLVRSNPFDP